MVNWIITEFILGVVFGLLCFVMIGIPFAIVLAIVAVVFPIVGAIKANDGEVWKYPCTIEIFKVD